MDFILVRNICDIHRPGLADNQQTHRSRPLIPSQDFTHRRRGICNLGMAYPSASNRLIIPSCRHAACFDNHRTFCVSRDKRDIPFLPVVCSPRRLNYPWSKHFFHGNSGGIWRLLCLQAPEERLTALVFCRNGRICGKHPHIPDNSP